LKMRGIDMPYKNKADKAAWQRENDGDAQRVIDYDARNPGKARARKRKWARANRAKIVAYQKAWRAARRARAG